jgi:hypothetical protein
MDERQEAKTLGQRTNSKPKPDEQAEMDKLRLAIRAQFNRELSDEHLLMLARRNFRHKSILDALQNIGHSWSIVEGNSNDLKRVIDEFQRPGAYRQIINTQHERPYQLLLLRSFHNFLASAIATIEHVEKAIRSIRKAHPETVIAFEADVRALSQHDHIQVADLVRDSSLHVGPQAIVLGLDGTSEGGRLTLATRVAFDTTPLREEIAQMKTRNDRQRANRERDRSVLTRVQRQIQIAPFVDSYLRLVGTFIQELRRQLLAEMNAEDSEIFRATNPGEPSSRPEGDTNG